jgi:hypothetical protein
MRGIGFLFTHRGGSEMKVCQDHDHIVVIYPDTYISCPLCNLHKWVNVHEDEIKELKEQLTELNLKMAPELSEDDPREDR